LGDSGVVADGARFEVTLHLDGLEHLLAGQFGAAAGLVDHFLRTRDAAGLGEDLAGVAEAGGQVRRTEPVVVAFQLGVGRAGRGQVFRLPLVVGRGRLHGADVGDKGRLLRRDPIDVVFQVFADADVGVAGAARGDAGDDI